VAHDPGGTEPLGAETMISIAQINTRLANLGLGVEVRKHAGCGLFFIVSTRDGGETILNSAMSHFYVADWAAQKVRDFYRVFVIGGAPFYPATGAEPIFHR